MKNLQRGSGLRMISRGLVLSVAIGLKGVALGAESAPAAATSPAAVAQRVASAKKELAAFIIRPGFKIEVVASEPMVVAPVAMAFDEDGRLFVAELPGYGERTASGPQLGRIRVLEGTDNTGAAQTSAIFADRIPWPSALACYGGGVFVASAPDLLFLKSSSGNGGPDVHQVVLAGFGGTNTLTSRTLPNNLQWSLENRFFGATAGIGGVVGPESRPDSGVSLAGRDFSFDPRTHAVFPETGVGETGLAFDNSGRRYICSPRVPLQVVMEEQRYLDRNPFAVPPPSVANVVGPAASVFQWSPASVSNVLLQAAAANPFEQRTNLLTPGWLTNAQGLCVYRGSGFPTNYLGNAFIPDSAAHVIHRVVLRPVGLGISAERPPDEARTEFLASKDPEFRPMQVISGPDGALYIADLRNGRDQGRIYRITPSNFPPPKAPELREAKTPTLVAALASPDGWHRDTAARLLYERQDRSAVPLLSNMVMRARAPLGRLHALHALAGLGALAEPLLVQALGDSDPVVREHGIRLCEQTMSSGAVSDTLWYHLKTLSADPDLRVRYQLALTVGQIRRPDRVLVLGQVLARDAANPWVQGAVLSSAGPSAPELFVRLLNTPGFRTSAPGLEFLQKLATMVGVKGAMGEVTPVLSTSIRPDLEPLTSYNCLNALGEGLHRTRSSLALVDQQGTLQNMYVGALNIATDPAYVEPLRVQAIRLVSFSSYSYTDVSDWLWLICNPPPVPAVQSAAITTLGSFPEPEVFQGFLRAWPALSPDLRNQGITAILSRGMRVGPFLDALERGVISKADLSSTQMNFLRTYHDAGLAARAVRLLGPVPVYRPEVVERYRGALKLPGAAERGQLIFMARCAACHRMGSVGQALGPDLASARVLGKGYLLQEILEPNSHLRREYAPSVLQSKEDENVLGIESDPRLESVTMNQPGGVRAVWPRLNIALIQRQPWSLMPTGLEQGMTGQDMADLLQFLTAGTPR